MGTGNLIEFAAEQQRRFDTWTSPEERKERGHFGTPPTIARFMSEMFSELPSGTIRILDPGAGVGTLSAGICQRILDQKISRSLFFELWENDPRLISILEETMSQCQKILMDSGHQMKFVIRVEDFILANTHRTLFEDGSKPSFHLAILNPPYFKLRKESEQAQAMSHVIYGQPNIYALFMAVAADLLKPKGEMAAITPRSYFNGSYFKRFRKWFFDRMSPRQIHIFESRTKAFKDNAVLQENVILHAKKCIEREDVIITSSVGREFKKVIRCSVPYIKTIDKNNGDYTIRVATNQFEHEIVEAVDAMPHRFRSLGLEISTGPVVTFRSTKFLRHKPSNDTAPLLWMHNVRPFITQFPPRNGKPTHIKVEESSQKLLVPARTYVLLKRFTAKEEKRRLVAGILTPADSYSKWIGLENHLNYVYRRGEELTEEEAFGLAAFFNSALVDFYFRAISGSTQVNATEVRRMPVPGQPTLSRIGNMVRQLETRDRTAVERIVGQALSLPRHLIERLIEVA